MNSLILLLKNNKDIILMMTSILSLLFSVFIFYKTNKNNKFNENISTVKLLLQNFYSPLLSNHNKNAQILFDEKTLSFINENFFLLHDSIKMVAFEIIKLEKNHETLATSKFLTKKYDASRKHLIYLSELASRDLSKIYQYEFYSISSKYLAPLRFRFFLSLLDFSSIILFIFIFATFIIYSNLTLSFTIAFIISCSFLWTVYRFYIIASLKNFKNIPNKPNRTLSCFNLFNFNCYSEFDAIYTNIFTKKSFLVYKGLPVDPNSKKLSKFFVDSFSLYKIRKKL